MVDNKPFFRVSRRMILIVTALAIILISSSIYAFYWSPPLRTGPRVSLVSPPMEFSLQLERTTFIRGENVSVSIGLKNIDSQTANVTWYSWSSYSSPSPTSRTFGFLISSAKLDQVPEGKGIILDFVVSNENDTVVFELSVLRHGSEVTRTLAPEEDVNQTFLWNMRSNISPYDIVPRGTYYVRVLTLPMAVEGWSPTKLETSSIAIEII